MKQIRFQTNSGAKAFTLIEILIVAALIALFSEIAMISASHLATQSKRKAATADCRSISDALTIAQMEFRFYPKLCYLSLPRVELIKAANGVQQIPADFDTIGFDSTQTGRVLLSRSKEILDNWRGPYFPSPAGRAKTCRVRLPHQPNGVADSQLFEWPADPWGNPYVVYLAGTTVQNGVESPSWITSPFKDPVYFARVVSHGPNGIPGGQPTITDGLPSGTGQLLRQEAEKYKLYVKEGNHFLLLLPSEYEGPPNRLLALKADFGNGEGYLQGTQFAGKVPGIMDPGSDDLSVPLH